MPLITRWMLKTSLVYFMLALAVGLLQSTRTVWMDIDLLGSLRQLEPVRIHLFVVGWITLLIFGVAHWMFPKYSQERPRGYASLAWASYTLLNIGLILRVIGETAAQPGTIYGWMLVASALFQWLAGLAFVLNTWPRLKVK
jgi:hypothetical protein